MDEKEIDHNIVPAPERDPSAPTLSEDQAATEECKKRPSLGSRIFRALLLTVAGIFLFLLLLTGLLYIPGVQTYIVNTTLEKLEASLGMRVRIGGVRIGFPAKIRIQDVKGINAGGDTVAVVDELTADVSLIPIIQGKDLPVSGIALRGTVLDYAFPNDSLFIKGAVEEIAGDFFSYKITDQVMSLDDVSIKNGDVAVVALVDTVPKPDTGEKSRLVIYLNNARINNLKGSFSTSLDTLIVDAYIQKGEIRNGEINIWHNYYQADFLSLYGELYKVGPEIDFLPLPWRVEVEGDKPRYGGPHDIRGKINHLYYGLGDGWAVTEARFDVRKDSLRGVVKDLDIRLAESHISGEADLPFDEWVPAKKGEASFDLKGKLLMKELERFIGSTEAYPAVPLDLTLHGDGEIDGDLLVEGVVRNEDLIDLSLDGNITAIFDGDRRAIKGQYDLSTKEGTMAAVKHFLDVTSGKPGDYAWTLPGGMKLTGTGAYDSEGISADFVLDALRGRLSGKGAFGLKSKNYSAVLDFVNLDLQQFLPRDTIGIITGSLNAHGAGTDLYSAHTRSDFALTFDSLLYKDQTFKEVTLMGKLKEHHLVTTIDADHEALKLNTLVDAMLIKDDVDLNVNLKVDTIIPSVLGIKAGNLLGAKFELLSNLRTDFKERYNLMGKVENFYLDTDQKTINPTNTYIIADTDSQGISAEIKSGDLLLNLTAQNGLNDFTKRIGAVTKAVTTSLKDSLAEKIDMASWMPHYPTMELSFKMGRQNALRSYLDQYRIAAQAASLTLSSVTGEGLKGEGYVTMFQKDTLRIDGLDLVMNQDSGFFYAVATAHKERFRNQKPFDILVSLTSNVRRSEANINWLDEKGADFMRFGLGIWNRPGGDIKVDFTPEPIVVAYNPLRVEGDNYLILPKENRMHIQADMRLVSDIGGEIYLHDEPDEKGHLLKADITGLKLEGLEGIQILPQFAGSLSANAEWHQNERGSLYTIDGGVEDFFFENKEIGDLLVTGEARQWKNGTQASAFVTMDDIRVADARYFKRNDSDADPLLYLNLDRFPLEKANPFLPKDLFTLSGLVTGEIRNYDEQLFKDDLSQAQGSSFRGFVQFRDGDIYVPMLNETYGMDTKRIEISDGKVRLEDFGFTVNGQRLGAQGTVGLTGRFPLDLNLRGSNLTILDSSPTKESLFYGLVNANVNLNAIGPADALNLTGYVGLLGSTKVTYVTKNSQLENKNGFQGLVKFEDFSDTLFVARDVLPKDSLTLGGANLDFNIHIDPAAELIGILTADGANKVQIKGGGDLRFTMPPYGEMQLTGMYNIVGGNVNLKVEPLSKRFEIDDGSSLIWSGELLKPDINFSATSTVNTRVAPVGENARSVTFLVRIIAENTLDDLKIRFETEAPEDLAIRNQLLAMNEQEMTRQSVLLLTTGQFIGSGAGAFDIGRNSGNVLGNVLSSYLASQINSFAGDALDAQINFGINDATTVAGAGTNYSYSIAKSFLNDRINVVVGGKVMTGAAAYGMEQTFIDNMSLEYQLDEAGTHYLRLFHNKNFENLLDGEVIETGIGYVMKRRFSKLSELFDFRKLKADPIRLSPSREADKDSIPDSESPVPSLPATSRPISKDETEADK